RTETGHANPKSQTRENQNLISRRRPMKPLKINGTAQNFSPYETGVKIFQDFFAAFKSKYSDMLILSHCVPGGAVPN
ncbi:MAG TPA: hypothetical protein VN765_12150, partial [Candidatus Acidoferrum sp.]|nr:hypothetical protein [Candidatus Acidoferrum sp.]